MMGDIEVPQHGDGIPPDLYELMENISENNEFHINITNSPYFEVGELSNVVSGKKT